jgi:hypothetical protein
MQGSVADPRIRCHRDEPRIGQIGLCAGRTSEMMPSVGIVSRGGSQSQRYQFLARTLSFSELLSVF